MKPSIGRIVIVRTEQDYNGTNEHPAIINRVWGAGDPIDAPVCVNITVLPDCAPPFSLTSVLLHDEPQEAKRTCWWPPRQ